MAGLKMLHRGIDVGIEDRRSPGRGIEIARCREVVFAGRPRPGRYRLVSASVPREPRPSRHWRQSGGRFRSPVRSPRKFPPPEPACSSGSPQGADPHRNVAPTRPARRTLGRPAPLPPRRHGVTRRRWPRPPRAQQDKNDDMTGATNLFSCPIPMPRPPIPRSSNTHSAA